MPTINLTPEAHSVFNEFDQQGLLLGLERLKEEKNPAYKQRLLDVFVRRASSVYKGLINGITRELGLDIIESVRVNTVLDSDGVPLATNPAVVFENTKCTLFNDFCTGDILLELDRFSTTADNFTIQNLIDSINETSLYTATLLSGESPSSRSMTIFNQSSVEVIPAEDISGGGIRVVLDNNNLVEGTVSVSSPNLLARKSSSDNLQNAEYFVDLPSGTVISAQVPAEGSIIRYKSVDYNFVVESSPVILHNLQSQDFKTKMFERVCDSIGVECSGLPTPVGADIINELLSVFASNYGP